VFGAGTNEGSTSERVSVLNPGATTATLTVERLRRSARTKVDTLTGTKVAPGQRAILELPKAGAGDVVLVVSADQPVVAQATMVRSPRGLSTSVGVPLPAGLVRAPGPS
jgi:hypothetical protein